MTWLRLERMFTTKAVPVFTFSGHASAEELKLVLLSFSLSTLCQSMARPLTYGLTLHWLKLQAFRKRIPPFAKRRESSELTPKGVRRGKPVPSGIILVDGLSVGDTSEFVLNERTNLGSQGVAVIACAVKVESHDLLSGVQVEMHGIPGGDEPQFVEAVTNAVSSAFSKRSLSKNEESRAVKRAARSALLSLLGAHQSAPSSGNQHPRGLEIQASGPHAKLNSH